MIFVPLTFILLFLYVFIDILKADGTAKYEAEATYIRSLTGFAP